VNGTVTDQSGAAISEVRITLTNINSGVRHAVRTGSAGVYSLTDIPPGNYTARAQRDGFATKEETGVILQVNETATLDFTMNIIRQGNGDGRCEPFGSGLHHVR
jgi:Carboxypeptidase regulatory-like domain